MPKKDPEKCRKIRDRKDKWDKYWTINRSLYYEWIDFVMGDQWREDESKLFERYNKIPLMMNKLGVLMNHLQGDQIQNTPNLQIMPDEDVPVETANTRAALIKNINLNSDTSTIYQTAYGQAVVGGFSAFRVGTEYVSEGAEKDAFDQEIKFYAFEDPNRCYWDLSAKHPCKVDGMFCGYTTRVSRQWFRDKFGKDIESQIGTTAISEDSTLAFADDDSITICDDFERKGEKYTIYKLSDNSVVDSDGFKKLSKIKIDGKKVLVKDGQPVTILDQRETVKYTIKHTQIAGDFILDEKDFPSQRLPMPFVDQKSYYTKQGQQITRSFFKDVKDAQKYLNYLATQSAYIMKVSRYDQFMGPRKCFASPDIQQMWRDPSVVQGALPYDETPSGDKPMRLEPPELSQSLAQQYERALMDIQSGTGMFNAQLGEVGNEISGTAVNARSRRGSKNTQTPRAALDLAIATAGEIVNEMIPFVYDTQRTLVLNTPDAESKRIEINQPADEYGMGIKNDMTKGRFKIRLKPGPSYEGQKEEALESLQLVLQADRGGQVFPMIADLYAENLPLDNNIELRNRLRTLVPPEIIEAGKTGKPLPPKQQGPDPQTQMIQMEMQMKMAELQHKQQEAAMKAELDMQKLELEKAELQRKAIESHQDMTMEWKELEVKEREHILKFQELNRKYEAEIEKARLDAEHTTHKLILDHHGKMVGHAVNHHKNMNAIKQQKEAPSASQSA